MNTDKRGLNATHTPTATAATAAKEAATIGMLPAPPGTPKVFLDKIKLPGGKVRCRRKRGGGGTLTG